MTGTAPVRRERCNLKYAGTAMCISLRVLGPGCASGVEIRDAEQHAGPRNQQLAAELTHEATELMHEDPIAAEQMLMRALDTDRFHGPAHNHLGVQCLNQGKLYEALDAYASALEVYPNHLAGLQAHSRLELLTSRGTDQTIQMPDAIRSGIPGRESN